MDMGILVQVLYWGILAFVALSAISPRLSKYAPFSGIAFVIALAVGLVLTRAWLYFPTSEAALDFFAEDPGRMSQGVPLAAGVGAFTLLWFAGSVYSALRQGEGAGTRFAPIALSGAIMTAIAICVGVSILWVATARVTRPEGLPADAARLLYDLNTVMLANVFTYGLAVFISATGIGSLRTRLFPSWFGWLSLVMVAGLFTVIHYIFMGLAFVWIIVLSFLLFRLRKLTNKAGPSNPIPDPIGAND